MNRPRVLIASLTAAVALAAAPAAHAGILQATSVLPPGESGFVSAAGVASGTGSPHLYDQTQPYINFARKDAQLGQPVSGTPETPEPGVSITRDTYGVPSVTGQTADELWWGTGYATAEDRLAELEIFKRVGEGRLAEIVGPSQLQMDITDRRDYYTADEISAMLAKLPVAFQQRYAQYADGINAYVDYVNAHPDQIPAEFPALGLLPTHFATADVAAIGIYLARVTPGGNGSELTNMQALLTSGPTAFNKILPLRIPGQVATIPARDGRFPDIPGRTPAQERAAFTRSLKFVRTLPAPSPQNMGVEYVSGNLPASASGVDSNTNRNGTAAAPPATFGSYSAEDQVKHLTYPIHVGGSYMVAVNDPAHHHAVFFDGPELGIFAPEELYEMELHGPGLDVRGVTAPGGPVIAIGHNSHVAFGVTAGLSETNTLYAERLVPGHPEEYFHNGRVLTMDCRNETFSYRSGATSLLNPTGVIRNPPQMGSVTLRICRTIHGPVQERVGGYAYARRYATWSRELDTLAGLASVDTARTVQEVNKATAELSWNCNLMAADDHGNIGYWAPGFTPLRPKRWDERLPLPGDGSAEWHSFLPVSQRPHVINPEQRWLDNWNTLPSQGWTTGNAPASERVAGAYFRSAYLDRLAARLAKHPTFAGMNRLIVQAGTTAQQRPLAAPKLAAALKRARGGARTVLKTILAWNGDYASTDANNTVASGVAAWQTFKDQLQAIALAPLGSAGQLIGGGEPNTEHIFDVDLGQAYALRTESIAGYVRAAQRTYAALQAQFGSADPAAWRSPRAYSPETSLGAESPPKIPFFDRGTFEEVFDLGPTPHAATVSVQPRAFAATAAAKPRIAWDPIPYGPRRRAEMQAYTARHYGSFLHPTWHLNHPRVIVIHFTETPDFQSTYNTFAPDVPDSELHELPGTCAHFVIDQAGTIHQLVALQIMCRHTVGLNWTSIGIEHVGYSDAYIFNRGSQYRASLRLVHYLRCRFHIAIRNVIGHNESLRSSYHHEDVPSLRSQTHNDFTHADMNRYRRALARLGGC